MSGGYGDRPYGDGPYGDDFSNTSIVPAAARMIQTIYTAIWNLSSIDYSLQSAMNTMGQSQQSMILTVSQNSCLQTKLLEIIESEGHTTPETYQHKLAVEALKDLQNTPPIVL